MQWILKSFQYLFKNYFNHVFKYLCIYCDIFITDKSCVTTDDGHIRAETRLALTRILWKKWVESKYICVNIYIYNYYKKGHFSTPNAKLIFL
jgi:hypothetical protein